MKDPIVEEVRRNRMEHTEEFRHDLEAICMDLHRTQEASGHEIIRLPARRLEPDKISGNLKKRR